MSSGARGLRERITLIARGPRRAVGALVLTLIVAAIVVGKPAADETIETWGTNHARPDNWVIWDGVPNE